MFEVVGIRNVRFTDRQGKQVFGTNYFLHFTDDHIEGVGTEKIWLDRNKCPRPSVEPAVGDLIDVAYDKYGKVRDIVPA